MYCNKINKIAKEQEEINKFILLDEIAKKVKDQELKEYDDMKEEMIKNLEDDKKPKIKALEKKGDHLKLAEFKKAAIEYADWIDEEIEKAKARIEVQFARFEAMVVHFDTVDALVKYAKSDDQVRSFFLALKCKADLDRLVML